ncbi:uncharacterized protein LOC128244925 [Mya arenaria]|uniref:uncharacterized protein LOC128244925 n=1 Tax=Mya arenaria TaxID=6604 RepID=UPI0022DFC5BA|nr:uncharacterized protein LOC128244925 [Mya arenaria]
MDSMDRRGMSVHLSRVLGDIGVNKFIIAKRRRTWLEKETMQIFSDATITDYHFGSQTEGTTTPGMQSDIDSLSCINRIPVVLGWNEWKKGKRHLLVIKTEESPPQHCWLQRVGPDLPLPELQIMFPSDVIDRAGRVLMSNTQVENYKYSQELNELGEVIQHGPSRSWAKNRDNVLAYHCDSLPEECKFLFQRPRPGHWPRPHTLAKAMRTGVFLVPQGYKESPSRPTKYRSSPLHVTPYDPYYPLSKREWRFSTSLMERLLIFDMTTIQLKVYVTIKIIRKTFLKPIVGDRLSTFHIKTAMMFTIETYPSEIWRKENLVQCVIYCLTTLHRWLNIKFCPHYTIAGVNLFTGKLFSHEINTISGIVTCMIASNLQCIYQIEMDSLGAKLSALSFGIRNGETLSRDRNNQDISTDLIDSFLRSVQATLHELKVNHAILGYHQIVQSLSENFEILIHKSEQGHSIQKQISAALIPYLRCTIASLMASRCIHEGQTITQDILNLYQLSFDEDLLSERLKFSSMLYCSGQYEAAANYLTYCEGLLGPEVYPFCNCIGRECFKRDNVFLNVAFKKSNMTMLTKHTSLCIHFTRNELCCIPPFLVLEMFRTISEEDRRQRHPTPLYEWMDLVVVDCTPFLHYLQFLTYMQLNHHDRAKEEMLKLVRYIANNFGFGHTDTSLNMIGHCCEQVSWLDGAWKCYGKSLQLYPLNNAAKWHLARLLHQIINH